MTQPTYERVKSTLAMLLADSDRRVIALSGKWGTGKTHLWRKFAIESDIQTAYRPVYVSIFGAKSITELKQRILQNLYLKDGTTAQKALDTAMGMIGGALKKATGYSAEDALLWLPSLLQSRLIVIDDVERKHKSLDIDELLGLIDEYSQNHKVRFLVLLNTAKLANNDVWANLHEKVIDVEIVLAPSPAEAFQLASEGSSSQYLGPVQETIAKLGIENIRVIKRVLKVIDAIGAVRGASIENQKRWIPSAVLLSAMHYRAVESGPSFEFVKSFNRYTSGFKRALSVPPLPEETRWNGLLQTLGIAVADEFESIVHEYLQTGLLNLLALEEIFDRYHKESVNSDAYQRRLHFFVSYWWDPSLGTAELIEMAKNLLPAVADMDAGAISDMITFVEELGDTELAREFLCKWLDSAESRPEFENMDEHVLGYSGRTYHPAVKAKISTIREAKYPPLTLVDAAMAISGKTSWGERERLAIGNSSVSNFVSAFRDLKNEELKTFLDLFLTWRIHDNSKDEPYATAAKHFVAACKSIILTSPDSRLALMISRHFLEKDAAAFLAADI